jgi:prepilin-type N-terminal cleavage/methylation domain-containing protein
MMKRIKGFTIIELLMVIAIISILVGVVVPRFQGMQFEANKAKAKGELQTRQTAVESYAINHSQVYPESTTLLCQTYLNSANPVIVNTLLQDPLAGGDEYLYELSSSGDYYAIYSVGQNGTIDITGVGDDGYLQGTDDDDIYVTNGLGWEP